MAVFRVTSDDERDLMKKTQQWVNLGLLVVAALVFVFLNQLLATVWNVLRLPLSGDWAFEPSQVIAFVVAVALAAFLRRYEKANRFLNEVVEELSKVSWAERQETVSSAGVVVIVLVAASLLLFLIDSFWRYVIRGVLVS